jgi:hydrogenase nickel incorporation protein HypA/HybF
MHERSLVRSLIEQVNEELRTRSLGPLRGIRLELGEFSGVEPSLLQLAFEEMARDVWGHNVKLDLEIIPLSAQCQTCHKTFHVEGFRFVCPECHGTEVQIRSGEQLQLVSLDVESANNSGSNTA